MPPEARICHQTPGRVRIRIPSRKGDAEYFERLRGRLAGREDIVECRVNPLTAGVLLVAREADHALRALGEMDDMIRLVSGPRPRLAFSQVAPLERLDRFLKDMSRGFLGLNDIFFNGMLLTGLAQILRGRIEAPPWYTAFLVAHTIYFRSIKGEADTGVAAEAMDMDAD